MIINTTCTKNIQNMGYGWLTTQNYTTKMDTSGWWGKCMWGEIQEKFSGTSWSFPWDRIQKHPQQEENNTSARTQHICDRFWGEPSQSRNNICFPLTSLTLLHFLLLLFALCSSFCTPQEAEIIQDKVAPCDWTKIDRLACKASQLHANLVTFS